MNAVGGFVPASGSVRLGDEEVGDKASALSGRAGPRSDLPVGHLFPELTVTETLLVALEGKQGRAFSTALALPGHAAEPPDRAEVADLVELLGLDALPGPPHRRSLDRYPAGGRAGRAAGAQGQGPLPGRAHGRAGAARDGGLRSAHRHRAASTRCVGLLIEHDMPLIMGISDRVYCLEAGKVIAEGAPGRARQPSRDRQLPRHRRAGHQPERPPSTFPTSSTRSSIRRCPGGIWNGSVPFGTARSC
jgi:hypothetical protein